MKLTADILGALRRAETRGNLLYLPGRLDSGLYRQVDAALSAVGARWDKGQEAYVLPGPAAIAVAGLCALEEVTTGLERKQATQFYPTPPDIVEQLISLAALGPRHCLLEPSAGTGAIAKEAASIAAAVDCVEADPGYAAEIQADGYARTVTVADFLAAAPEPRYDRVIMNPPFTRGADVAHVRHALRFVKPGGRLVAVMYPSARYRASRAATALRELIGAWGGWFEDVPAGAFAGSGTGIGTVIAVIPVPGGPAIRTVIPGAGEVTRVTTDVTDYSAPLFRPAADEPGAYVHNSLAGADRVFRFAGNCVGCGARTWAHDDGGDDARGPFGWNTCLPLTSEDFPAGSSGVPDDARFPRCMACWNDAGRHQEALKKALACLRAGPAAQVPYSPGGQPVQLTLFGS